MRQPNLVFRMGMKLLPEPKTFLRFTSWVLPDLIKRKIVMVASFCEVERLRGVAEPRVDQLNEVLDIVDTKSLLYCIRDLAIPLSNEYFTCKDEPCWSDMAQMCLHLARRVPPFLRYDEQDKMVADIAKVVAFSID